jgi:malate dehydrogenase (oxaloacetate-decarboxylating)(NADP+)
MQQEIDVIKPSSQHPTGYQLLHDARRNKGTAFTEVERREYGLEGLLPPTVATIELQIARRHAEIETLDSDLQKYLVLSDLQARNETLFYAVLMSDPATYMPLVYTPTVGEACQKFAHIFRQARGIYLPITARSRVRQTLEHWPDNDHHVAVEIGDDPDRAGDDEKDDQHAKGEGQNIVCAVGPAAQMQKEDEMDADLR